MIADVVSAATHVIVGAVVWVCTLTAIAALTAAAIVGAGCHWGWWAAVGRARQTAWKRLTGPRRGPGESRAARTPPRPPRARTAPHWAHSQPLDYHEAA